MADVVVVAASVAKAPGGWLRSGDGTLGETVTAGQPIVRRATDGLWVRGQATTGLLSGRYRGRNVGIALNGGAVGQPVEYVVDGKLYLGVALTRGIIYCVSAILGGIAPSADLVSGNYVTILGTGDENGYLDFAPWISGVNKP